MKSYLHWYWFFKFLQSPPFWHTTSLHSSTSEKLYDKFELISLIYGISFEGQVPPPGNRLTLFLPKMGLQCQSLQSFKHCYQKDVYFSVSFLSSGPNRGRSPVEWVEILSVRPSVPLTICHLVGLPTLYPKGLRASWRGLRAYQRGLRACQRGLGPAKGVWGTAWEVWEPALEEWGLARRA